MKAFGTTDFRSGLGNVTVPTLVLHVIAGAPHGCNVSHAHEFNATLVSFLAKQPRSARERGHGTMECPFPKQTTGGDRGR